MATTYKRLADQYYDELVVSTTDAAGTIGKVGIDFGFLTSAITVINDKSTAVYVSYNSTAGSTLGHKMSTGETLTVNVNLGGMSLASTTTTTGDKVRVLAVGL